MSESQTNQEIAAPVLKNSVRLGILAAIFSGAAVIVPLFVDAVPRALFAVIVH